VAHFPGLGHSASRKPATQFGSAAYQAAPSFNARPHYPDLPESPLPEKEQCIMIGSRKMAQLHTPAEAAEILKIRESWLRAKAAARVIPCTFIGKHLRFSEDDIAQIMAEGARQPVTRGRGTRR
jgi:excisionase family DNA binding protein